MQKGVQDPLFGGDDLGFERDGFEEEKGLGFEEEKEEKGQIDGFEDDLANFIMNVLGCDVGAKIEIEEKLRRNQVQQVGWLDDCTVAEWKTEFGMSFYQAKIMVKTLKDRRRGGNVSVCLCF